MSTKVKMTSIGQLVPELPVADVERAQQHYRDALGFEIGWLYPGRRLGLCHAVRWRYFFGKGYRPSNRPFTGCSLTTSMRRTENCGRQVRTSWNPLKKSLGTTAVYREGSGRQHLLLSP